MTDQLSEPQASPVNRIPTRKVGTGAIGGAVATVIIWVASVSGLQVPPEVAAASTTIIALVVSYLVPEA